MHGPPALVGSSGKKLPSLAALRRLNGLKQEDDGKKCVQDSVAQGDDVDGWSIDNQSDNGKDQLNESRSSAELSVQRWQQLVAERFKYNYQGSSPSSAVDIPSPEKPSSRSPFKPGRTNLRTLEELNKLGQRHSPILRRTSFDVTLGTIPGYDQENLERHGQDVSPLSPKTKSFITLPPFPHSVTSFSSWHRSHSAPYDYPFPDHEKQTSSARNTSVKHDGNLLMLLGQLMDGSSNSLNPGVYTKHVANETRTTTQAMKSTRRISLMVKSAAFIALVAGLLRWWSPSLVLVEAFMGRWLQNRRSLFLGQYIDDISSMRKNLAAEWGSGIQKIMSSNDETLTFVTATFYAGRLCLAGLLKFAIECCLLTFKIGQVSLRMICTWEEKYMLRVVSLPPIPEGAAFPDFQNETRINDTATVLKCTLLEESNDICGIREVVTLEESDTPEMLETSFLDFVALKCPMKCWLEPGVAHHHIQRQPKPVSSIITSSSDLTSTTSGSIKLQSLGIDSDTISGSHRVTGINRFGKGEEESSERNSSFDPHCAEASMHKNPMFRFFRVQISRIQRIFDQHREDKRYCSVQHCHES